MKVTYSINNPEIWFPSLPSLLPLLSLLLLFPFYLHCLSSFSSFFPPPFSLFSLPLSLPSSFPLLSCLAMTINLSIICYCCCCLVASVQFSSVTQSWWLPRHRKMKPFPATAPQEKSHVRNWRSKGHLAPLMRPTKFPEIPVSFERNTEVFQDPLP